MEVVDNVNGVHDNVSCQKVDRDPLGYIAQYFCFGSKWRRNVQTALKRVRNKESIATKNHVRSFITVSSQAIKTNA